MVAMSCELFHGGDDAVGCVTTGGTESIILACKTFRDLARDTRGVEIGEILVPETAHAAFDKAAEEVPPADAIAAGTILVFLFLNFILPLEISIL